MSFELKSNITNRTYRSNLDVMSMTCISFHTIPSVYLANVHENIRCNDTYHRCPVCGGPERANSCEYEGFIGYEEYYGPMVSSFQKFGCAECWSLWFRVRVNDDVIVDDAFYWANPMYEINEDII